jgi:proteasome assembly chaperone 3
MTVPTRQSARTIDGVHTEVLVQRFADRILILVTSLNKIGHLIQVAAPAHRSPLPPLPSRNASMPELQGLNLPPMDSSLQLTPLMGQAPNEHAQLLHHLYAVQIASIVFDRAAASDEPWDGNAIVVGLALRGSNKAADEVDITPAERKAFAEVMKMVLECRVW